MHGVSGHRRSPALSATQASPWHDVPVDSRTITASFPVIVTCSMGSRQRYALDTLTGRPYRDSALSAEVHYAANVGFIPRTLCDHARPLDVLVLGHAQLDPLTMTTARAVGALRLRDGAGFDDKILAVNLADPTVAGYTDHAQLPDRLVRETQRFVEDYGFLVHEALVRPVRAAPEAVAIIREALARYRAWMPSAGAPDRRAMRPGLHSS